MPKATWNNVVLAAAEAGDVQHVEGNLYFPPSAVERKYFRDSATHTVCPWKGTCSYYKPEARHIQGFVAFWKGIKVE
jgi:uncharacterized protein (DUF427 family)